jgi:predicted site-specific integrase-resolvase
MQIQFLKTAAVARSIGVSYHVLLSWVRFGKIPAPTKDSSGDYVWLLADVERARQLFESRKAVPA